jgi:hypothetical protein
MQMTGEMTNDATPSKADAGYLAGFLVVIAGGGFVFIATGGAAVTAGQNFHQQFFLIVDTPIPL